MSRYLTKLENSSSSWTKCEHSYDQGVGLDVMVQRDLPDMGELSPLQN